MAGETKGLNLKDKKAKRKMFKQNMSTLNFTANCILKSLYYQICHFKTILSLIQYFPVVRCVGSCLYKWFCIVDIHFSCVEMGTAYEY